MDKDNKQTIKQTMEELAEHGCVCDITLKDNTLFDCSVLDVTNAGVLVEWSNIVKDRSDELFIKFDEILEVSNVL